MSFNFGPTLLSWLKENAPRTYRMILDGERRSRKHFNGHSSAMAQVYNHIIMPLANQPRPDHADPLGNRRLRKPLWRSARRHVARRDGSRYESRWSFLLNTESNSPSSRPASASASGLSALTEPALDLNGPRRSAIRSIQRGPTSCASTPACRSRCSSTMAPPPAQSLLKAC